MNEIEINARINALEAQRNEFANRCVLLMGVVAMKDAEIAELKKPKESE